MRIINAITEEYKRRVMNDELGHIPSSNDVVAKYVTYEYYRANGELLRSETVTDRELTKEEIWNTLNLVGADRVRWIFECGIIPTILGENEYG